METIPQQQLLGVYDNTILETSYVVSRSLGTPEETFDYVI